MISGQQILIEEVVLRTVGGNGLAIPPDLGQIQPKIDLVELRCAASRLSIDKWRRLTNESMCGVMPLLLRCLAA
jgi:hypothetical protein